MLVDIGEVKKHIKPKADSTLLNMRKDDLIEYIRTLEHNYNVAVSFNENQARYIESLGVLPNWIPVAERLPDLIPCNAGTAYSEAMIVWTDGRKAMMAVWDGKDFICPRYYWDAWEENITHWMPLPEPPKEGE